MCFILNFKNYVSHIFADLKTERKKQCNKYLTIEYPILHCFNIYYISIFAVTNKWSTSTCSNEILPYMARDLDLHGRRSYLIWHQILTYMARDLTLYGTRSYLIWHEILPYMARDLTLYGTRSYLIWHEFLTYMARDLNSYGTRS